MCRKEAGVFAVRDDFVATVLFYFLQVYTMENYNSAYESCILCPRECKVNRSKGKKGFCGADSSLFVARAALHMWEEPCISGESGSGAVFFSGCNLHCVYCQNHDISHGNAGKEISVERLCEIFFELEQQGANNINLVTGTHYIPHIVSAVKLARSKGFSLPFVYNSSGYESIESIKLLSDCVDIFLPDYKYSDSDTAALFSHAKDYPEVAFKALKQMYAQCGEPVFDDKGLMKRGMIVRVLVLPGHYKEAIQIITKLYETFGDNVYISIMRQYTPIPDYLPDGPDFSCLKRRLTSYEYDSVVNAALDLGIKNAFVQGKGVESESFIPPFDGKGV